MRRKIALFLAVATAALGLPLLVAQPAQAHGWITSPPSRQDHCAKGRTSFDCGPIKYEPQSVEAPKGSRLCSGGSQFRILDSAGPWPVTSVGSTVTFTWKLTAAHRTTTWQYYIGSRLIKTFDQGNQQPPTTVSHTISGLPSGRQTVLAVWNVADTAMAFYACVDLQVGGGGGDPQPPPPPPPGGGNPTPPPPPPPSDGGTWKAGTTYAVGDRVTYGGRAYQCQIGHTALTGWEPPNVPALWRAL